MTGSEVEPRAAPVLCRSGSGADDACGLASLLFILPFTLRKSFFIFCQVRPRPQIINVNSESSCRYGQAAMLLKVTSTQDVASRGMEA